MNNTNNQILKYPAGIWIALAALMMTLLAWIMQLYSLINWEGALELGLQNESFTGDAVERALANVEYGVALADMVWPLPLTLAAFIGIFARKQWGMIAAMMNFAICVYFPLFFAFQKWDSHPETAMLAIILFAIPSLAGISALWINRKTFN
jgi:hypothetical protein